jgi:hypothetical protein
MAVIVNITAWSITSNQETLPTSNTGWGTSSTSPFGTQAARITNSTTPNAAYNESADHTLGYLRDETPGSANQTVRITVKRRTLVEDTFWYVLTRVSTNNWIGAFFARTGSTGQVGIVKCVAGIRTTVATHNDATRLNADGGTGLLELVVTGQSPTISASVKWAGVQVIAPQTITDAALDGVGKVGLMQRTFTNETTTAGIHVTTFYAEDDSGGSSVFNPLTGRGGAAAQILGAH